jgi:hypothetical protein
MYDMAASVLTGGRRPGEQELGGGLGCCSGPAACRELRAGTCCCLICAPVGPGAAAAGGWSSGGRLQLPRRLLGTQQQRSASRRAAPRARPLCRAGEVGAERPAQHGQAEHLRGLGRIHWPDGCAGGGVQAAPSQRRGGSEVWPLGPPLGPLEQKQQPGSSLVPAAADDWLRAGGGSTAAATVPLGGTSIAVPELQVSSCSAAGGLGPQLSCGV